MINWAAFYSDCVHEVKEVTSGHRVTLTYNLYVSRGTGMLAGNAPSLTQSQLPLYKSFKETMGIAAFRRRGALLGFYLAHAYPHTHKTLHKNLPAALKGADMVLYECVKALKLKVRLVPVMNGTSSYYFEDMEDSDEYSSDRSFTTESEAFDEDMVMDHIDYEWQDEEAEGITDEQRRERRLANEVSEAKCKEMVDNARAEHEARREKSRRKRDRRRKFKGEVNEALDEFREDPVNYGSALQPTDFGGDDPESDYGGGWGTVLKSHDILWITKPKHKEVQMAYMAVSPTSKVGDFRLTC